MADDVLFVFCWDHECVSAYGMCPLVVVVVVVVGGGGGGGRRERFESKSSAMTISNEYISGLHRIHTADLLPDLFI